MNILVSTLPIKPQKKTSIGMSLAPFLTSLIGESFQIKSVLSTNLLHSYDSYGEWLNQYVSDLNKLEINFSDLFVDEFKKDILLEQALKIISSNLVIRKKAEVLLCECGKVDVLKSSIRKNQDGDNYYIKDGKIFCKCCHKECHEFHSERLYLTLNPEYMKEVSIFPNFYKKSMAMFYEQYKNMEYMISKERKTGYNVVKDGRIFSLDIDFLWMNFPKVFKEQEQILIASNHQLFEMFLLHYINSLEDLRKLYFVATPYLKNPSSLNLQEVFQNKDALYQKLCLLYTLKWRCNNSNWDMSMLKGIGKLSLEKRQQLEHYISSYPNFDPSNIEYSLQDYFVNYLNYQSNLQLVRKGNNNV